MAGKKITETIEINADTIELLDMLIEKYKIKNKSKLFRVLLDYVIDSEKNWDIIFKKKRCKRC